MIDDVHELDSSDTLRQLELLVRHGPAELRVVLASRREARLGLHRLRLEGELTEIRGADLGFTLEEARALLETAGVVLPESAWGCFTSGPRASRPGCGWPRCRSPRTPIRNGSPPSSPAATGRSPSYLLAEVLERQPEEVRRLLLRTSVLERVSGEARRRADRGRRRRADACRSWSRPARSWSPWMRAARGSATTSCSPTCCSASCGAAQPGELAALHGAAARWYAEHGYPMEAVRHAQAAQDWDWPLGCCSTTGSTSFSRPGAHASRAAGRVPGRRRRGDAELTALRRATR